MNNDSFFQRAERIPTIGSITVKSDDGKSSYTVDISFPTYSKVGVYTYILEEVPPTPKTAGVTYSETPLYVVVTVTNAEPGTGSTDTLNTTVAVHQGSTTGTKDATFTNEFGLGKLTVTKSVSGNLASNTKKFSIDVTFTGENVSSPITYTVAGGAEQTVDLTKQPVVIELANGESAVFTNIPAGMTYSVVEEDKHIAQDGQDITTTEEGYTVTYEKASGTITAGDDITAKVMNEKKTDIDTGVILDSLPYVLILVAVLGAAVLAVVNKRRSEV